MFYVRCLQHRSDPWSHAGHVAMLSEAPRVGGSPQCQRSSWQVTREEKFAPWVSGLLNHHFFALLPGLPASSALRFGAAGGAALPLPPPLPLGLGDTFGAALATGFKVVLSQRHQVAGSRSGFEIRKQTRYMCACLCEGKQLLDLHIFHDGTAAPQLGPNLAMIGGGSTRHIE